MNWVRWANGPFQAKVATLMDTDLTQAQIAKQLDSDPGTVARAVRMMRTRAARQGDSPEHDMTHPVPDGYMVRGVSTYYDQDGKPTGQWVKSQADHQRQLEILLEQLEQASAYNRPFKPKKPPKHTEEDLASLITITDYHLGMLADPDECGEAWDTHIAREVLLNAIHDLIMGSPRAEIGILNQLGDFLHFDSLAAITPTSGHLLDADTRYGRLVELTMTVMTQAVKIMLSRFQHVHVIQAEGNHDIAGSVWLRKHIKHMFVEEPRVTVDDSDLPYYAYLHGETMLAFHHGHKMKLAQLHKFFAAEPRFRGMWGKARQTYIHTGHLHHERVIEDGGAIAEQHPTLAGRDAYAARGGWISQRGAKAITYHKTLGEVHRVTVRPRVSEDG